MKGERNTDNSYSTCYRIATQNDMSLPLGLLVIPVLLLRFVLLANEYIFAACDPPNFVLPRAKMVVYSIAIKFVVKSIWLAGCSRYRKMSAINRT
jgi:hypothetical protein